jgi:hypothetical protein
MLSARLVHLIEDHAEELFRGLLDDLQSNPRTPAYHRLDREELRTRLYGVYRHLGRWLADTTEEHVESVYSELGRKRHAEGIPLSEVVYALTLAKYHLRDYIRTCGLMDSAVELYQEQELQRLVGRFFDRAVYHTVRGYEHAVRPRQKVAA